MSEINLFIVEESPSAYLPELEKVRGRYLAESQKTQGIATKKLFELETELRTLELECVTGLERISIELVRFAIDKGFGIRFNPTGYDDELLKELRINWNYFSVCDSFYAPETVKLFCHDDCYNAVSYAQCLENKYGFLNQIIKKLFSRPEIKKVSFYITDCQAIMSDYTHVKVEDRNLTKAFANEIIKQNGSIPTVKFEIW